MTTEQDWREDDDVVFLEISRSNEDSDDRDSDIECIDLVSDEDEECMGKQKDQTIEISIIFNIFETPSPSPNTYKAFDLRDEESVPESPQWMDDQNLSLISDGQNLPHTSDQIVSQTPECQNHSYISEDQIIPETPEDQSHSNVSEDQNQSNVSDQILPKYSADSMKVYLKCKLFEMKLASRMDFYGQMGTFMETMDRLEENYKEMKKLKKSLDDYKFSKKLMLSEKAKKDLADFEMGYTLGLSMTMNLNMLGRLFNMRISYEMRLALEENETIKIGLLKNIHKMIHNNTLVSDYIKKFGGSVF